MNYNASARKTYSKKIISTNDNLSSQHDAYKERLTQAITDLTDESSTDCLNRKNLLDSIHCYSDTYNEIRFLNHYKLDANYARDFMDVKNIKLSSYILNFLDESEEVTFEDCSELWKPFIEYSPSRSSTSINQTKFWEDNTAVPESNQKAIPATPTKKEFQEIILKIADKPYVVANDILDDCTSLKEIAYSKNDVKTTDYSYLENKDQIAITPAGEKVSYSKFSEYSSFSYKTYTVENNDSKKTEKYATRIVNNEFSVGKKHLFYADGTFGIGKVIESHVRVERVKLKTEYSQSTTSSASSGDEEFDTSVYESSDIYWDCNYYANITFEFNVINGSKKMYLLGDVTSDILVDIIEHYSSNLKSILNEAYTNSQKTIDLAKIDDEGKYENYMNYLSEKIADLSTAISVNNTIVGSIKNWVKDRIKKLSEAVKDETIAETCISMIKERENRLNGSLFGWYSQTALPLSDEYERYLNKIENNLCVFRTMLVAPAVDLDYTDEKNGGQDIKNPNFVDLNAENYTYYKKTSLKDFQVGDTVYLVDDNNPEISASITKIEKWTGSKDGQDIELKRVYLDISVPEIYSISTLRVIRL